LDFQKKTTRNHIIRSLLESFGFRARELLDLLEEDWKVPITVLHANGGACENDFIVQWCADMLGIPIDRCAELEASSVGIAFLAGLHVGVWKSKEELKAFRKKEKVFEPSKLLTEETKKKLMKKWKKAASFTLKWESDDFYDEEESEEPPSSS